MAYGDYLSVLCTFDLQVFTEVLSEYVSRSVLLPAAQFQLWCRAKAAAETSAFKIIFGCSGFGFREAM